MKIALLAPLRHPIAEPFAGGLEIHTLLLARGLTELGHEVTLFAHPGSTREFELVPCPVAEGAGFLTYTRAINGALRRIKAGTFGVLYNNSIHFLPPLMAREIFCPVITVLHTPPYRSHRLTARLTQKVKNHAYVSISHFLAGQWSTYIGNCRVVHNGLNVFDWPFSPAAEPKTAIWYGRFTPEKGAEYAIGAARAAGYRLRLAGPVTDPEYFRLEVEPILGDGIEYVGHKTQRELATLVGRSAVGLVTSVWEEPFGLAFAEMLACGTPVAGFASGAAAEIVTPECGALVDKRDVAALTRVLGEVEKSKDRAACRARVEASFTAGKMVQGYLELYANISAPPRS